MAMVALTESHFGRGTALCFQSQMGFSFVISGSFKLPQRHGKPPQQHRCILNFSKVSITSTLSTNSVIFSEYRHAGARRRRNALRPKLLKTLEKPKIIIETNDNSKVDAGNSEPYVGDNSKGNIVDSEATVNGVGVFTDENSKLSIVGPEPNINVIQNISEDFLEVVNGVESFRFGNSEVEIMRSELSANVIPFEFPPDGNAEIHIGSSECNMNETKMITNPDPESVIGNDIGQNSAIESPKKGMHMVNPRFIAQAGKMWDSWKSWHAQYQKDIQAWGVGQTPIFLVFESGNGEVKVSINEDEIRNRCVAQPFLSYHPDEARISYSRSKITHAKQLAEDIEAGVFKPPRNSTLFEFVDTEKNDLEKLGVLGSFFSQASSVIDPPSPVIKTSIMGFVVLISSVIVWGAWKYIFCNGQVGEEKQKISNSMAKNVKNAGGISALNSQNKRAVSKEAEVRNTALVMNSSSNGKPPPDDTEFNKKIEEIQAMARQARMIEKQRSEDFSEPQDGDYPLNARTMGRNTDGIREEDSPSNLNLMTREAHDFKSPVEKNYKEKQKKANSTAKNVKNAGGISALNSQNKRAVSKEVEVRNTALVMNSSSNGKPPLDETEFNKKIQEIQAMARQARMIEKQSSEDFSEQQDGDYPSNARTMGRNTDGIREEDSPSILNMMTKEAHDFKNPDEELYKEKQKIENSTAKNVKNAGGISALNPQNKRAVRKEVEVRNTALVMNSSSNGKPSLDETEFNKKIQEIQDMARQARPIEKQSSNDFSEQKDGDYPSNARTMGRNTDGIREEDSPSNLNMMTREAHDFKSPDESNFSLGNSANINTKKEVNNHVQNTLLFQQAGLKKFSQGAVGNDSTHFKEDQNSDTTLKETKKPKVDTLQYGQSSAEKVAENEKKESVDERQVKQGLGKKNGFGANRSSLKGSQRIKPPVIKSVNKAREIIAHRRSKHGNKSRDTSNPHDKKYFSAESVGKIKNTAIAKEEISSKVRVERESNEKLKLNFREVENESEEKVASGEALDDVSLKHLETAQAKAMMDSGNKRGTGLETQPETGIQDGNNTLSQEAEELEWMSDEVLRKIIFKVQDNEKAGREPLHGLVSEAELLFFRGMERKFEREGESVKIWIKERVEKLTNRKDDSGVDDPPKSSTTAQKDSDETSRSISSDKNNNGNMFMTENMGIDKEENQSLTAEKTSVLAFSSITSKYSSGTARDASYKSDKNLDRSVSEEKSEDALLFPERKLGKYEMRKTKIIKEHEMDDWKTTVGKENECQQELQNLLWWMDLPYVLCIGLYRNNKGKVLRGLYSLEMVPGIESDSKPGPYHAIAFQDHADAKHFCYILQSHYRELGDASVHVIPLSSKEFYEEAMSTACRVTVIKKGELQLYIGQPVEEVESRIVKIGSAIYSEKNIDNQTPDIDTFHGFGNRTSSPA